jgi:pyruvate dehydrogenase E2 component (dihydrolipoamide acetyltransferase)
VPFEFRLPDIGEGIHEGEIVKWFVKPGDTVKEDDVLCEVQNDKAVVEIPSPVSGTVEQILIPEGTVATVGQTLVSFDAPGYEHLKFKGDHEDEPKKQEVIQPTVEPPQLQPSKKLSQVLLLG